MFTMLCLVFYFKNFALIGKMMAIRWAFSVEGVTKVEIEEIEIEGEYFQMYFGNRGDTRESSFPYTLMLIMKSLTNEYKLAIWTLVGTQHCHSL